MKTYEYGRIKTLAQNLEKAGIDQEILKRLFKSAAEVVFLLVSIG